jgi:NAD(P)-dependent dehydrogenase (short-subunit alcohol dehydrogenase family)
MIHYISSKMAVIGFTRALATEVGASGVTVNAVAPSLVETPGASGPTRDSFGDDIFELVARSQPINRVQTPEDLVGVISFLASDDSAFITAQTFSVDGGRVRL